jgi:hypothetical protein
MNEDMLKISYEDLLRDPDLIDRVQRDARRYRAREIQRVLSATLRSLTESRGATQKTALRTAPCA